MKEPYGHHSIGVRFRRAVKGLSRLKALTALLLSLVMLTGLSPTLTVAAGEEQNLEETQKPEETPNSENEQGPEETPESRAGESPEETPEPEEGESPKETPEPEAGESPEETPEPEAGESPEETPNPEETDSCEKIQDSEKAPDAEDDGLSDSLPVQTGLFSMLTFREADGEKKFSEIVDFKSISLYYTDAEGRPEGDAIGENALIEKDKKLALRYTFDFTEQQCSEILADTEYYLSVSPHLELPHLESGSPLTIETEDGATEQFGTIYADGNRAWVTFTAKEDGTGTVLSGYATFGLENVYFYLNCNRAGTPPADEPPIEGNSNLYVMKFENSEQFNFGYAENEPLNAKAKIKKDGSLAANTINWRIDYTPWQNPSDSDSVTMDSAFELRDRIDGSLHSYVADSARIDGVLPAAVYPSRDEIPADNLPVTYLLMEEDGTDTVLTFGGTAFNAGKATGSSPAAKLEITYETSVNKELLLPGKAGDKKVTNAARLFDMNNGNELSIDYSEAQKTVTVLQPEWLEKTGKTTRHTDGTGSTTDWEIIFLPNGFSVGDTGGIQNLTLHDKIPYGSELVKDSVKIDGNQAAVTEEGANEFTVPLSGKKGSDTISITYQTQVPESMYDNGTSLGNNIAWFTFSYNGADYSTPTAETPVGSGDGSGTPGTATLVKTNRGYNPSERTIDWTVKINPHRAYLKGGDFVDDLSTVGSGNGVCSDSGHPAGLELVGDVEVLVDDYAPDDEDEKLIGIDYKKQVLSIKVGKIGAKAITLNYTTKVCDPCVFANNTVSAQFTNTISSTNMLIGSQAVTGREVSADSTAKVDTAVLTKKAPVYDYETGIMKWTIEVNAAELPMKEVVLKDILPVGLTYVDGSLATVPSNMNVSAGVSGQELIINLGTLAGKTTVTFDTETVPEKLGFGGGEPVVVDNTIRMNGKADGVEFTEVSHRVEYRLANHGLVKSSRVDNGRELIQYEVLINPFGLSLPENPEIVDTLDRRLQLDTDTLRFYKATVYGNTGNPGQKPDYQKVGNGEILQVTGYDPAANSFTVQLPVEANSREAYVLTYTADIIEREAGGYGNSVRFDGGSVVLGGNKHNSANVGGGGGGGGGVVARKAGITIAKMDADSQKPLAGVTFTLYQWDSVKAERGLPFARGITDEWGRLSFMVKPGAVYELVETEGLPGYSSTFKWDYLPKGAEKTDTGLLLTAGEARSEMNLELTNEAYMPVTPPDGGGNSENPERPGDSSDTTPSDGSDSSAGTSNIGTDDFDESSSGFGDSGFGSSIGFSVFAAAGARLSSGNPISRPHTAAGGDSGSGADYLNIPRTGDSTPQLLAIVSLSGILLAAMMLYWFLQRVKIKENKAIRFFFVLLLLLFSISCTALAVRSAELYHGNKFYEQIREEDKTRLDEGNLEPKEKEIELTEEIPELSEKLMQFAGEYPGTVAWLQLPGTSIDYPVMSGTDNQFYLNHLPDGSKNVSGSLFLDCRTGADSLHLIIYGHNMLDGKMFGLLKKYESPDYFAEHKTLTVAMSDSTYVCPIFSVRRVDEEADVYKTDFKDKDALTDYAMRSAAESLYQTDVNFDNMRGVVTLSTCIGRNSQRLIVQAVLPT